jgi:hypothetical protein
MNTTRNMLPPVRKEAAVELNHEVADLNPRRNWRIEASVMPQCHLAGHNPVKGIIFKKNLK